MAQSKIILNTHYNTFSLYKPYGVFKSAHKVKSEINIFGSQVSIRIPAKDINMYVWFGVANDIFNTIIITNSGELFKLFGIDEIQQIVKFSIKDNLYIFDEYQSKNIALSFQWCIGRIFLMISSSRRSREPQSMAEDFYGDDLLYVHGIWEVELSLELKQNIFRVNYFI